jgi:murein DD-endopeptidase MepM/ murein hydrolase activator NlpD
MKRRRIIYLLAAWILFLVGQWLERIEPAVPPPTKHPSKPYGGPPKAIWTAGSFRPGENLWNLFSRLGIDREDALRAIRKMRDFLDMKRIRAGDRYEIARDSLNRLLFYRYQPSPFVTYEIRRDSSRQFIATVIRREPERRIEILEGAIRTTLYESMRRHGAKPELILAFSDIFQWDIDFFTDPQPGDRYRLVYEAFYLDSIFTGYGRILAAQYILQGKPYTAFFYQPPGKKAGYYEWSGQSFQKKFLRSPLNYRRISSYFSPGRRHPILKRVRPHYGIDYAAPRGTPVVSPADGTVVELGYKPRGVGRYLKIRHDGTHFVTLYGHLQSYARGIRKGVHVRQRQVIGYVGSTGLATGPHLHYTLYENGRPINPLRLHNISADPLQPAEIPAFQQRVFPYLRMLAEKKERTSPSLFCNLK